MKSASLHTATIALLVMLAGCDMLEQQIGPKTKIAVYPGAQLIEQDSMGHMAGENFSMLESYDSTWWIYKTADPLDEVIAFYEEQLPQAEKTTDTDFDDDDNEIEVTVFTWVPDKAKPDDDVTVTLSEGKIEINETYKRK